MYYLSRSVNPKAEHCPSGVYIAEPAKGSVLDIPVAKPLGWFLVLVLARSALRLPLRASRARSRDACPARYAAAQRVQSSRLGPHNGLTLKGFRHEMFRHATWCVGTVLLTACAQAGSSRPSAPAAKPPAQEAAAATAAKAPAKPSMATSTDGTRIAYEMTGAGPALMLLHGGGQTRRSWNEGGYVDRLAKRFTVITVDQRGSGDSDKPATAEAYALDQVLADLIAVADAAGAKRFHLWGYGHGASIGRYLAARSDRVISAVLMGATLGPTITGVVKDAIVAMRAKWQPLLEAKRAGTLDLNALSPGDRAALEGGTPISALSLGALVDYPPLEPADLKAPTLWLVGSEDSSAMENVKAYEGKLTGTAVTLKILNSMSYSDCFIKIDQSLAAVDPFLAGVASS
jgi:pimeloyl-ACP methyl ester carboxylesterase